MRELIVAVGGIFLCGLPAFAVEPAPLSSTLSDQAGVAVTIYNSGLGLVKDRRHLELPRGRQELRFMDVAARILPASVHITSISAPQGLRVLEQNYEYDLLNPQKLMDKYVGKEVKLLEKNPYTEREEVVTATLLANNGAPIYRIGNDITFTHPGRVILPGVPENLIAQPTLVWLLQNDEPKAQTVEATYLTNGIGWRADYVLNLNERDDAADLTGWVTIDNRSGAAYRNAVVKLVAGDVNRVSEEPVYAERALHGKAAAAAPFREQPFFEYHLYSLERPATLKDNQTKQIGFVTVGSFPVRKEYLFRGESPWYLNRIAEPAASQKVSVNVEFENRKREGLGMPLPKGTVRVYKRDSDGTLQFIGEDAIDHTPKDEKVRVKLGETFDLVGTRKQTDWKKLAADTYEAAFEVTLRNHKDETVTVKVVEPVPGDWTMVSSSHPYRKGEAFVAEFDVPVGPDGEAKLSYRVRTRY